MTLIEVTATTTLVLGLIVIAAIGITSYRRASQATQCLLTQSRMMKEFTAKLSYEIDSIDVGVSVDPGKIARLTEISYQNFNDNLAYKCSNLKTKDQFMTLITGASTPAEFESWYHMTFDQYIASSGATSMEAAMDMYLINNYQSVISLSSGGVSADVFNLLGYNMLVKQLGRNACIYLYCPRTIASRGVTKTAENRAIYHANW